MGLLKHKIQPPWLWNDLSRLIHIIFNQLLMFWNIVCKYFEKLIIYTRLFAISGIENFNKRVNSNHNVFGNNWTRPYLGELKWIYFLRNPQNPFHRRTVLHGRNHLSPSLMSILQVTSKSLMVALTKLWRWGGLRTKLIDLKYTVHVSVLIMILVIVRLNYDTCRTDRDAVVW